MNVNRFIWTHVCTSAGWLGLANVYSYTCIRTNPEADSLRLHSFETKPSWRIVIYKRFVYTNYFLYAGRKERYSKSYTQTFCRKRPSPDIRRWTWRAATSPCRPAKTDTAACVSAGRWTLEESMQRCVRSAEPIPERPASVGHRRTPSIRTPSNLLPSAR